MELVTLRCAIKPENSKVMSVNDVDINWYSVAWNTQALSRYLDASGDPNKRLNFFFVAQALGLGFLRRSCAWVPFGIFIIFVSSIPSPYLIIINPLIYCCQESQPLILIAIITHNLDAIKNLVAHGADITSKSIRNAHPLLPPEITPLELAQAMNVVSCGSISPDIISALTVGAEL